ncbi:hypothetical protein [Frondihabitans sp. VKM Ac-2883]|uniref:hypothetical protein n=1 Tax=Frondihabitans sp. VKM Ac-2883 TaxID=2783823 RepID=UPI00188A89CA|nr:hypothetical protein [Frondihabitans sp. VKM Ac-2883]
MTRKRLFLVLAVIAVAAVVAVVIVVASHLPERGAGAAPRPSATPVPTATSAGPTPAETAFTVADLFCRPDATQNTWQRSLSPHLTADAAALYSAVRPANVPCQGIRDDAAPVGDQQTGTDRAYQFTASTGGPVTITLHRDTPSDPWLASYINAGGQE